MANIYELTGSILELQEMLQDSDEQVILDTLESLNLELEQKADGYAKIIKNIQSDIDGLKLEEQRLSNKRRVYEKNIDNLKRNLEQAMLLVNKEKFKTDLFSFNIQKNPPSLKIDDDAKFDESFYIPQDPKLDTAKIKEMLKLGNEIAGARLEQSKTLRIK